MLNFVGHFWQEFAQYKHYKIKTEWPEWSIPNEDSWLKTAGLNVYNKRKTKPKNVDLLFLLI